MDFLELWEQMGMAVRLLMGVLVIMSMASVGVFFERLFTFVQAAKQSKVFAPQVAKHLKDGKLKEAITISQSKNYKYSHLGKVVLAGLQEYQFQQDSGVALNKDDVVDSVHRAIQRASALTSSDLKRGMGILATIGSTAVFVGLLATTIGVINAFQGIAATGVGRSGRRLGRYLGSPGRHGHRSVRGDSGGLVLQLPDRAPRVLRRRDGQLVVRAGRLLHQEVVDLRREISAGCVRPRGGRIRGHEFT